MSFLAILIAAIFLSILATSRIWAAMNRGVLYKIFLTVIAWVIPLAVSLLIIHITMPTCKKYARARVSNFTLYTVRGFGAGLITILTYIPILSIAFSVEMHQATGLAIDLFLPLGYALSWLGNLLIFNFWILDQENGLDYKRYSAEKRFRDKKIMRLEVGKLIEVCKFLFYSQARLITVMSYITSVLMIFYSIKVYEPVTISDITNIQVPRIAFGGGLFVFFVAISTSGMLATYERKRQELR